MMKTLAAMTLALGVFGLAPADAKADGWFGFSFGDRHDRHHGDGWSVGFSVPIHDHAADCCCASCRPVYVEPCYPVYEWRTETYLVCAGRWDRVWVGDCGCGRWEYQWIPPVYGTRTVRVRVR